MTPEELQALRDEIARMSAAGSGPQTEDQILQQEAARSTAAPPTQAAPPATVELPFGDQKFSGTPEEVTRQVREAAILEARQQLAREQQAQAQREAIQKQRGYDPKALKTKFGEILSREDGDFTEAFDEIDRARFGFNPREVLPALMQKIQQQDAEFAQIRQVAAVQAFKDKYGEELPADQTFGAEMQRVMAEAQIPVTPQGLDMAYQYLKAQGRVKPREAAAAPVNPYAHQAPLPPAPPRGSNGDLGDAELEAQLDNMNQDQLMALMLRMQGRKG